MSATPSSVLFFAEPSTTKPLQINSSSEQTKKTTRLIDLDYRLEIVWYNVLLFCTLHLFGLYGIWLMITQAKWMTNMTCFVYLYLSVLGIGAGAHRLWAHRTYKARLPLRIFLMIGQSIAMQNDIYVWVRDHRVHHKFTDTNADPHNSRRGFFFSHMGWLLVRKHRDVFLKGKTVDLSDLEADPVVMFQKKYYKLLSVLFGVLIPMAIQHYFWNEKLFISIPVIFARYAIELHATWLVNSAAHIYGTKPYNRNINPTENKFVAVVSFGEGWHNYHHVFPWDYKAAELGNYRLNMTTAFLDLMAKIGWAYDLKTASPDVVKKRARRTGDGTWRDNGGNVIEDEEDHDRHHHGTPIWGWGDRDMKADEIALIKDYNKLTAE